jgi:multidrug efflux pump subunit AcrA (membrane-fusion protein)
MTSKRLYHKNIGKLLLIIILLSMFLTACGPKEDEPEVDLSPTELVLTQEIRASGEVFPKNWVYLSYPSGATDLEFFVSEGDQVKENDLLVTSNDIRLVTALTQAKTNLEKAQLAYDQLLEPPAAELLASAKAALANAEANLERQKNLFASDLTLDAAQADVDAAQENLSAIEAGATDAQIQAAKLDIETAEAAYNQAQNAFDLYAPFSGTVVEIHARQGEAIGAAQPLITLADLSDLQIVTTDLSEVDVTQLVIGLKAEIVFDALPDQTFLGTVTHIAFKSTGTSSVNYEVILTLDEIPESLRWGMSAFISFPIE